MFFLPIIVSLFALVFAYFLIYQVKRAPLGSGKQCEIFFTLREGIILFFKKQSQTIGIVIVFFLIFLIFWGPKIALGFLIGIFFAVISGFLFFLISTEAYLRIIEATKRGLENTFDLSFKTGAIIGFSTVGLGLLSISLFYFFTKDLLGLLALTFGISFSSLLSRMGGGIYEKVSELWEKAEKEILKEDLQNAPLIAQEVGRNIREGMGRVIDLLETYLLTVVAGMVLGSLLFPNLPVGIFFPLILASVAILAKIPSTFLIRLPTYKIKEPEKEIKEEEKKRTIIFALLKGLFFAGLLSLLGFLVIVVKMAPILKLSEVFLFLSVFGGLLLLFFVFLITNYFPSKRYFFGKTISLVSQSGYTPNIIESSFLGINTTILLIFLILLGLLIGFWGGIYSFAIALTSFLSLVGIIIALGSYNFLLGNALTIAKIAGSLEENRETKDVLETLRNVFKNTTEGYAFLSTGLLLLLLFFLYTQLFSKLGGGQFFLENPQVLIGLFIGGIIVYYFATLLINAVTKTTKKVVEETKKEFPEIGELKDTKTKRDYKKYGEIITRAVLKETRFPIVLPIVIPFLAGYFLGPEVLAGFLLGSLLVGVFLLVFITFGETFRNNTKKEDIEETTGPLENLNKNYLILAINPFIKVLNIVTLLIVKFLV